LRRLPLASFFVLVALTASCNKAPPEPPVVWPADPPASPTSTNNTATTGSSTPPSTAPTVTVPSGPKPTTLEKRDLIVGTGAEATSGRNVRVQYTGVAWSTGRKFDSSWDRGAEPFSFRLGAGMVIPGWDQGVAGMRVGGRRQLIIPPHLAYGERGAGANIGPNETLIFVVDLVAVE
jgi:peptidylprolyl isomerase